MSFDITTGLIVSGLWSLASGIGVGAYLKAFWRWHPAIGAAAVAVGVALMLAGLLTLGLAAQRLGLPVP